MYLIALRTLSYCYVVRSMMQRDILNSIRKHPVARGAIDVTESKRTAKTL